MRDKHTFQFSAKQITRAARAEARYHREREEYWKKEQSQSLETVKATAKIVIKEMQVTGGVRPEVVIDYGDYSAYQRMCEAYQKAAMHREAAEKFETEAEIYGSQDVDYIYQLEPNDVHYFRLGGGERKD